MKWTSRFSCRQTDIAVIPALKKAHRVCNRPAIQPWDSAHEMKNKHTHMIWGKYLNEHFSTIGIVYNFHLSKFMSQVIRCETLLPFSQLVLLLSSARMTIALHSISFLVFFFWCCYCWLWTQASYHTAIVRMNSILYFFNFESWSVHLMGLIHDVRSLQKWNSALHTSFHAMVLLTGMRATNPSSWS